MAERVSNLAAQLRPYWLRDVAAGTEAAAGVGTSGLVAHALSGPYHTGTLAESQAPWAATKTQITSLAGAGLTYDGIALAVGAGNGLTVNADDVALTTPGTLTAATSNSASGSHTHAVTTGAASTLTVSTTNTTGTGSALARADHTHAITASADVTAGTSALLKSSSGNLKLGTGNIGTTLGYNGTFTSGFAGAGWQVDYGITEAAKASATFDNLTIRGRMRVYELLIQQIRATNGSVLVSSSSKVLTVSADDDPIWTVNGATLQFNGVDATLETTIYTIATSTAGEAGADRTHYHGFLVGDIIRAQQVEWDGSEFGGVYQSNLEVTGVGNLYTYQGARVDTVSDAPAAGYDYVRIGSASNTTRQGVVYLTSDDSAAPFIDIVDGVASHAQWNTAGKIRARLGRLDGITDAQFGTLDGYGLWSDNVYLTGSIYATDGIFNGTVYATDGVFNGTVYASAGTFTGAITAQSGSIAGLLSIDSGGEIRQGTGTLGSNFTGLRMWYDTGVGRIGGYNSDDLQWYAGTDGKFYTADADGDALRLDSTGLRLRMTSGSETFANVVWCRPISTADITTDYHGKILSTYVSGTKTAYMQFRTYVNTDTNSSYVARTVIEAQGKVSGSTSGASMEVIRSRTAYYINMNAEWVGFGGYTQHGVFGSTPSITPATGYLVAWFSSSGSNYVLNVKDSAGTVKSVTLT